MPQRGGAGERARPATQVEQSLAPGQRQAIEESVIEIPEGRAFVMLVSARAPTLEGMAEQQPVEQREVQGGVDSSKGAPSTR